MPIQLPRFEYFEGPPEHMSDLCKEPSECSFCGATATCFAIDTTVDADVRGVVTVTEHGCVDCLQRGQFEFWHDTEIGMLNERGLRKLYSHHVPPPPDFRETAIAALRKTPQFISCQQETWLAHCADFMVYLGTWTPLAFCRHAPDGDGRSLFLRMTARHVMSMSEPRPGKRDELERAWDEVSPPGGPVAQDWGVCYYAFRCRHCGVLRGYYDFD